MSITPPDNNSGQERLEAALLEFVGVVGTALEDICSYGLTIGEAYVPFNPDEDDECDDDEVMCSQIWVRVAGVAPLPNGADGWGGDSCSVSYSMDLEVGVIRCIDVPEDGEAPTAMEVTVAGLRALEDMNTLQCAALGCEVWDSITVGSWVPLGPLGGQYGGVWTFTVEL